MSYSKEEKAMWLEDWRQSGKSATAYAKANGLVPWTFVRWTKAVLEQESTPHFVDVSRQVFPSAQSTTEILIEKGDMKIHLPLSIGNSELRTIIESLGGAV